MQMPYSRVIILFANIASGEHEFGKYIGQVGTGHKHGGCMADMSTIVHRHYPVLQKHRTGGYWA